jgi:hypothetical protein
VASLHQQASNVPTGVWRGEGAVILTQGVLTPGVLLGWQDIAEFDAMAESSGGAGTWPFGKTDLDELTVSDSVGTNYAGCHAGGGSASDTKSNRDVLLEPAPPATARWVEFRGKDGSSCRVVRGDQARFRLETQSLSQLNSTEREVEFIARSLIGIALYDMRQEELVEVLRSFCKKAAKRSRELRSLATGSEGPLLDDLDELCAVLPGFPLGTAQVPERWRAPLVAAELSNGRPLALNIGASLPPMSGVELGGGAVVSGHEDRRTSRPEWRVTVSASPFWFEPGEQGGPRAFPQLEAFARDDCGGWYSPRIGGTHQRSDYEGLVLNFRPRLDPAARTVTLWFQRNETAQAVHVDLSEAVETSSASDGTM